MMPDQPIDDRDEEQSFWDEPEAPGSAGPGNTNLRKRVKVGFINWLQSVPQDQFMGCGILLWVAGSFGYWIWCRLTDKDDYII